MSMPKKINVNKLQPNIEALPDCNPARTLSPGDERCHTLPVAVTRINVMSVK